MSKKACVLVCVTSQPDCERLIRAGKKIADGEGTVAGCQRTADGGVLPAKL